MDLNFIKDHVRNRPYMSGIDRDKSRVKQTQECFTKDFLVTKSCNLIEELDPTAFSDPTKTYIDPTGCGDGQFLGEVLIRKVENGIDFETSLRSIYGVDIMEDNVKLCQDRLLCGQEHLRKIVENNIVCANSLAENNLKGYHFRFDGTKGQRSTIDNPELFE